VKGRPPTQQSFDTTAPPAFNGQYQHDRGDEKQASKAKKFLKPSKEGMKEFCYVDWFSTLVLPFSTGPPRATEEGQGAPCVPCVQKD